MPIKHQTDSYRNRGGLRYICYNDEQNRGLALIATKMLREEGWRAFFEQHQDGAYFRVFVEERWELQFKKSEVTRAGE